MKKVSPIRTAAPSPTKKSRRWLWPVLIVGVLAVGAVGFMMLKSGEGQTSKQYLETRTKELCERVVNARTSAEFREARIEAENWFDQLTTEEHRLAEDIVKQYEAAIEAQYERFPQQGSHYGYGWVDLGLPSGLKWATQNGHKGYEVMGRDGYSIFLPAAGSRFGDTLLFSGGEDGGYWSSTPDKSSTGHACDLGLFKGKYRSCTLRYYGLSVRPVLED